MDNLEKILNKEQCEAAMYTEGPLLVLAGAGSGKTRVLTHRIAYLIENKNVAPWNILAITFTNKAAGEMRERVNQIVSRGAQEIWVSTFHSMCVRILRRHIEPLGYSTNFSIYDGDDSRTLMRRIFKDLNIDTRMFKERAVLSTISAAKNDNISPEEFLSMAGSDIRERTIANLYREYQKQMKQNDALDFDDLINKTVELFRTDERVLGYYQERFRYIMVDEYQDTNNTQFELVRMLADKYHNLCVVGDDDQSIYKFRGANLENILSFEKSFPGAHVVKLEQNYRSTKNILDAANAVIANNKGRKPKRLWTAQEGGAEVIFKEYETANDEADAVIRAVRDCGYSYKDQAILYRTNAQSRLLEERCVKLSIPYRLVGGVNFYQRREIKDILAYLRVICNGLDDLSLERIINVPKRGVGATSLERVRAFAREQQISLYDAVLRVQETGVSGKAAKAMQQFGEMIEVYRQHLLEAGLLEEDALPGQEGSYSLKELIESLRDDTGYAAELLAEGAVEAETRFENIEEFINKAVSFTAEAEEVKLAAFLEEVALVADIDRMEDFEDKVTLMTLHGAKGLEFPKVYLVGMEEGLFPSYMSITSDDPDDVEEERRLCYVGITRAREELVMTSARSRMVNGEFKRAFPSRFIDELPDELVHKDALPRMRVSVPDDYEDGLPWEISRSSGGGFSKNYNNPYASGTAAVNRPAYGGGAASYGQRTSGLQSGGSGSGSSFGSGIAGGTGRQGAGTGHSDFGAGFGSSGYRSSAGLGAAGQSGSGRTGGAGYGAGVYSSAGHGAGVYGSAGHGTGAYGSAAYGKRLGGASQGAGMQKAGAVQKPEKLDYVVGDRVSHVKFGEGTVVSIVDGTKDYEVSVAFDTAGQKKMFASFAKLKKI